MNRMIQTIREVLEQGEDLVMATVVDTPGRNRLAGARMLIRADGRTYGSIGGGGREADVQEALRNPDEIRLSRSDPKIYLFYGPKRGGRWACAVAKRLDGDGFLITAYPTDTIKEGERIWPK